MDTPDAMQTTFTGDGPTTHVVIPREIAEADLGMRGITSDQFIAWIDANNDRIYESARKKRATPDAYEEVMIAKGDLLSAGPIELASDAAIRWAEKADLIRIGTVIGSDPVEFGGTLTGRGKRALHVSAFA